MKEWYYKFVKLKGVRKFVNLISWIIRGLAVLDGALVAVLQLDVFDNIITRINALFNASWTSIEVKTNLYIWLVFFVGTELLLRGIRYSHKIRELLFLACSDLESTLKKYKFGKNDSMKDYIEILKFVDLTKYKISLVGYAQPYKCSPFENWNKDKATQSLPWYEAYNKIKHNREENFHFATLENCINAIAANLVMFAVRFSPTTLYNENDVCSNLARSALDYKIENSRDFYIPVFEGKKSPQGQFGVMVM